MSGVGGQDGVGGDPAHSPWSEKKERGVLRLRGSGEAQPRGVGDVARSARREAEIGDDQRESRGEKHLRRRERLLDAARPHPEKKLQVHAG